MKRILAAVMVVLALATAAPANAKFPSLVTPTTRDGRHEGNSTVTPFWHGEGNLEDGDLSCPHQYILGLTARLLFYSDDTYRGTPVIVRYKWTHFHSKPHFEQAFSADHGKTWETNWITDCTR